MKRAFDEIAKQTFKVIELEKRIVFLNKAHAQEIEKYQAWNKQDCKVIGDLRKEVKLLKEKNELSKL